ncbi:hypothetical protein COV19_05485 [Candidatus Woesearchaeota archaeon CG10_big_fil_rev_8_21_14_0_10_44_13]|nr:MAG: hypothetical protein COV19_05485 [Candidatus Woesearchaeota archaeon CG10_big_fil_rev_8_21_14_0_10_44_13]
MKKQKLSVVIAVKNEEDNMGRCLDSVRWADEIIIINNGSTDKTAEICKRYTKNIYSYPKKALIPQIQNEGIKRATKEWVMILDADVVVPAAAKSEILDKITRGNNDGYYLYHKHYCFGKFLSHNNTNDIMKLFRRDKGRFECEAAHCHIKIEGRIGSINSPLLHYAHPDISTQVKKSNLYSSQDAEMIFRTGKGGLLNKRIRKINIYTLLIEPVMFTFYMYFFNRLYKEGLRGVILSILMGNYLFMERAKVLELQFKAISSKQG